MTRQEHLKFCTKCINRKRDPNGDIICKLTDRKADFEGTCRDFKQDDTVIEGNNGSEEHEERNENIVLDEKMLDKLKAHQDFSYALAGGLLATLISAILWAVISISTKYQIGYMAIGVGLLVGFSIRLFGAGIDKKFGYLGAVLSLVGCMLGNLFTQVGFIAQDQSLGYFETLTFLTPGLIVNILVESFSPMDILFYGIAVYEGYKISFRRITPELLIKLRKDDQNALSSSYKLRLPLVIVSILILTFVFVRMSQGVSGHKTFKYESGRIMSEGEYKNSKEHGKWVYYYENGETKSTGYYNNGLPDSLWQWYSDGGRLSKIGNFRKGLEHGVWVTYYDNGFVSDSGAYAEGRMQGQWIYRYDNGRIAQSAFYERNFPDSIWASYYDNGQLNSVGKMKEGKQFGDWRSYFINGQISEELIYGGDDKPRIINAWDINGKQLVLNGNGIYKSFSPSGTVLLTGKVENGSRTGLWNTFYENGRPMEEGKFEGDIYVVINCWDGNGIQMISDGSGNYTSYYADGKTISESGELKNGLRTGIWHTYLESNGAVSQELQYVEGKLTGLQKYYFETGELYLEGEMVNNMREGEWEWYYENGNISSSVDFIKDKKEGKQEMWSETGEKTKEEYYKNGVLIKEKSL